MVSISDKFGKASISTGYATATTVKTARTEGVAVLETFDLSDFAPDTPVFFVTYKKTTDPVTGKVTVTSQTSWKALVNPDNNTLTNLTLAPGYEDIGNEVGDFVECIPTSFWGNSLIEGLFVHMNADGTLKAQAVKDALGLTGVTPADWNILPVIPTVVSSNGQKEHVIRYSGVDYRTTLGEGTKLRIPRTGTTPTTSMAFVAASSQYAVKTSPTGITFTDDFTLEAWVYVDSFSQQTIIGKYNLAADDGFTLSVNPVGAVTIYAAGAAGAVRRTDTYQSITTGKWTHIAATMDASAGASRILIDGIEVPAVMSGAATSIVQAGNLQVGAHDGANSPANMKIANARIWSTVRTPAEIRDNMNKETPASTTGLVAHFKGNGSWNDSSANANHLTAVNGAVNNFASHPYSANEFAIQTKPAVFSGGNTDVTIFTGSGCLPNETLGATSYSTARAPFGFPADKSKWTVATYLSTDVNFGVGSFTTMYYAFAGLALTVPSGAWKLVEYATVNYQGSTGATILGRSAMSTENVVAGAGFSLSSAYIPGMATRSGGNTNSTEFNAIINAAADITIPTQTTYRAGFRTEAGGGSISMRHIGSAADMISYIKAECAYL
jgi:hypothetical protein